MKKLEDFNLGTVLTVSQTMRVVGGKKGKGKKKKDDVNGGTPPPIAENSEPYPYW